MEIEMVLVIPLYLRFLKSGLPTAEILPISFGAAK
jgi:hypothetical protein